MTESGRRVRILLVNPQNKDDVIWCSGGGQIQVTRLTPEGTTILEWRESFEDDSLMVKISHPSFEETARGALIKKFAHWNFPNAMSREDIEQLGNNR